MTDVKIEDIVDPMKPEIAAIKLEPHCAYLILFDENMIPQAEITALSGALWSCDVMAQFLAVEDVQHSVAIFKLKKEQ